MQSKAKLVCGVGTNDCDYPVTTTEVINGRKKRQWRCPFYRAWTDMLIRCCSAKFHSRFPSYAGCTVAPEWHSFSAFRGWMVNQDWEGKQLDKDILIPSNRVYGPYACVFVHRDLNSFLTDSSSARGEWPIGAHLDISSGKFQARCHNPFTGKRESLGKFDCPDAAHEAWRARKHELACAYADQQTDHRVAAALRIRYTWSGPQGNE